MPPSTYVATEWLYQLIQNLIDKIDRLLPLMYLFRIARFARKRTFSCKILLILARPERFLLFSCKIVSTGTKQLNITNYSYISFSSASISHQASAINLYSRHLSNIVDKNYGLIFTDCHICGTLYACRWPCHFVYLNHAVAILWFFQWL